MNPSVLDANYPPQLTVGVLGAAESPPPQGEGREEDAMESKNPPVLLFCQLRNKWLHQHVGLLYGHQELAQILQHNATQYGQYSMQTTDPCMV